MEESTILKTRVETIASKRALEGKSGFVITPDYREIPVYSAYGPLDFEDVRWAVLAEIDEAEVLGRLGPLRNRALLVVGVLAALGLAAGGLTLLSERRT